MLCFPNYSASNVHPFSQISVQASRSRSCHDLSYLALVNVCCIHIGRGGFSSKCWLLILVQESAELWKRVAQNAVHLRRMGLIEKVCMLDLYLKSSNSQSCLHTLI